MDKIIWADCEMTGINVDQDRIIEISLIITDSNFNKIDHLDSIVIKTPQDILNSMNDWCKKHFNANGLVEECLKSNITIEQADDILKEFMIKNKIKQGILAGNSIGYDRRFLDKYCPKFTSHLHYRMLDVSSIKILANFWYKDTMYWDKQTEHRTLSDIHQSIEELKYYKQKYFINFKK